MLECISSIRLIRGSKQLDLLHLVDFTAMHIEELRAVQRYAGHMLGLLPLAAASSTELQHAAVGGIDQQQGPSSRQATLTKLLPKSKAWDCFWQQVYNRSSVLALDGSTVPTEGTCMAEITAEHVEKGEQEFIMCRRYRH